MEVGLATVGSPNFLISIRIIIMKTAAYLLLLATLSCQRNKGINPKDFQLLEGKWERTAYQINQNEWVADSISGRVSLIFRADGVPLDGDGFGFCCPPQKLLINGRLINIEPKSPVTTAAFCQTVRCRFCETIEIQVTRESMLWIDCNGGMTSYRRLP